MTYHRWNCAGYFSYFSTTFAFRLLVSPACRGISLRVGGLLLPAMRCLYRRRAAVDVDANVGVNVALSECLLSCSVSGGSHDGNQDRRIFSCLLSLWCLRFVALYQRRHHAIKRCGLFVGWDTEDLMRLARMSRVHRHPSKSVLLMQRKVPVHEGLEQPNVVLVKPYARLFGMVTSECAAIFFVVRFAL